GAAAGATAGEKPAPHQLNGMNYGTFAVGANGQQLTGEDIKNLPLEAQWAMSKGLSPVLGANGQVLGYDVSPMESRLAAAVMKDYAAASKQAQLAPGAQGPCPQFINCNSSEAGQLPPPAESDPFANMGADSKNHCDQPGPPPPCKPKDEEKKEEDPKDIAKNDLEKSEKDADKALESGDDAAGIAALTKRNDAEDRVNQAGGAPGFGTSGADAAFDGPGPSAPGMTGGQGQGIGAQGQVGGDPFAGAKQVRATPEQEWAAKKAEKEGMRNPLLTPSGPAISVAERMRRGFDGTFATLVGYKDELFGKSAAVEANPEADLSAGEATSAIVDGARTNAPVVHVTSCRGKKDTLGGSDGDLVLKSPNGC
ncbi:MAG: hypothetical protein FD126_3487, partial [Elusimicrobia bacterium]